MTPEATAAIDGARMWFRQGPFDALVWYRRTGFHWHYFWLAVGLEREVWHV